jgi:F-type H+-transporting ATPase subunit delta
MRKTSRAYAQAAFGYARDHQDLESWYALMQQLQHLKHPAFKNPQASPVKLQKIFEEAATLSDAQSHWIRLLATHQHIHLLSRISGEFIKSYQTHQDIHPIKIITARELSTDEQSAIEMQLQQILKKTLLPSFTINSDIIGGVQVEYNGKLIDHSFAKVLNQLHTRIQVPNDD